MNKIRLLLSCIALLSFNSFCASPALYVGTHVGDGLGLSNLNAANLTGVVPTASLGNAGAVPLIILDDDVGVDAGDQAASAQLAMCDLLGLCHVIAVTCVTPTNFGVCYDEVNYNYWGLKNLTYGNTTNVTYFAGSQAQYDPIRTNYWSGIGWSTNAPEAVGVLRYALVNAPRKVRICMGGEGDNIADLLNSPGDLISPLTGIQLVSNKVEFISVVFGEYPNSAGLGGGSEWNALHTTDAHKQWFTNVPPNIPIYFSSYGMGTNVLILHDSFFTSQLATNNPLYTIIVKPGLQQRSWDSLSAMVAVFGTNYQGSNYFSLQQGSNTVVSGGPTKGSNYWVSSSSVNWFSVTNNAPFATISNTLNGLLTTPPNPLAASEEIAKSTSYVGGGRTNILELFQQTWTGPSNSLDMRFNSWFIAPVSGTAFAVTNVITKSSGLLDYAMLVINNTSGATITNWITVPNVIYANGTSTNVMVIPNNKVGTIVMFANSANVILCGDSVSQ